LDVFRQTSTGDPPPCVIGTSLVQAFGWYCSATALDASKLTPSHMAEKLGDGAVRTWQLNATPV
jgi:hypothetical protein